MSFICFHKQGICKQYENNRVIKTQSFSKGRHIFITYLEVLFVLKSIASASNLKRTQSSYHKAVHRNCISYNIVISGRNVSYHRRMPSEMNFEGYSVFRTWVIRRLVILLCVSIHHPLICVQKQEKLHRTRIPNNSFYSAFELMFVRRFVFMVSTPPYTVVLCVS